MPKFKLFLLIMGFFKQKFITFVTIRIDFNNKIKE